MADFTNTIDLLGDEIATKAILDRSITEFYDDVLRSVGERAFSECVNMLSVKLPNVTALSSYAFQRCTEMTSAEFQSLVTAGAACFGYNAKLEFVDCGNLTKIENSLFSSCPKLKIIILRRTTICTISNTNAFTATPFVSGATGGIVYVPQALIESYQTATNWSTLYAQGTCNFVAIEGSEYE